MWLGLNSLSHLGFPCFISRDFSPVEVLPNSKQTYSIQLQLGDKDEMATHDQHDIAKDVSSRKRPRTDDDDGDEDDIDTVQYMHNVYVKRIKTNHRAAIEKIEDDHDEEIAKLKGQLEMNEKSLVQREQTAAKNAVEKERKESSSKFMLLESNVAELQTKNQTLQSSLEEVIAKNKNDAAAARGEARRLQDQLANLRDAHATEIGRYQRQLKVGPNSKIELEIVRKGRVNRKYTRRLHSTFTETIGEYFSDLRVTIAEATAHGVFVHNGGKIKDWNKTLQQVCINI